MADRVKPYSPGINYWLFATDPEEYSYDRLERDTATVWDGVTDYVDLKNLRDVETGEEVLIFHAGTEMSIVGIARITSDPYPDPRGMGQDQVAVDLVPERRLERPVALAELQDLPELQDWDFVEDPDLAVAPVTPEVWKRIQEVSASTLVLSTQENQE
jgi:predicted RNA-binding protein with PUA-like domain